MTKNSFAIKVYQQSGEILVAACDEELLGKKFEDGELQLEVHTSFYDGFRVDERGLVQQLQNSTMANLVGEQVINCVINAGIVTKDCIIRIQNIPHAQIFRM